MAEVLALLAEDPRTVGSHRLEGRLGVGGQGTVYLGRGGDGGPVAVKLLHPHLMADHREQKRFLHEVETARRVAPFCTAQILDCGFLGGRPYIVSEFVDGPSLHDAVRDNGPRGAAALQRLAINTATALMAIHEAGVVHRDFKPGNVLLGPEGPVVIDFGIARALDLSQSVVSSQAIGSPAYMAPEQISGGDIGPASDLFAWGATMVYAATGQHAFTGESIPAVLHTILHGEPDLGGLDGAVRALLEECLSKVPARRPTAAQVIERLRALPSPLWNTVPVSRRPGRPAVAVQKADGRRRGLVMGTAGATLLVAAAAAGYFALVPAASGSKATGTTAATAVASVPVALPSSSAPETPTTQDTPAPAEIERSSAAEAVPSTSAVPRGTSSPTRRASRTKAPVVEPTQKPTKKPTRKPTTRPTRTTPPPSSPPAPSQGSITFNDAHEYCKAQGYSMAAGNWSSLSCFGMTNKPITATAVCQWKYQGRDAVAEEPQYAYSQETACRLS